MANHAPDSQSEWANLETVSASRNRAVAGPHPSRGSVIVAIFNVLLGSGALLLFCWHGFVFLFVLAMTAPDVAATGSGAPGDWIATISVLGLTALLDGLGSLTLVLPFARWFFPHRVRRVALSLVAGMAVLALVLVIALFVSWQQPGEERTAWHLLPTLVLATLSSTINGIFYWTQKRSGPPPLPNFDNRLFSS